MADLFDADGFFTWPRHLENLEGVPEECAAGYVEDGDGFKLHDEVVAEVEAADARLAEMQAEHEAAIAEQKAKLVRLQDQTRNLVAGAEVRKALAAAGVKAGLAKGAESYLLQKLAIEVEPTADGGHEVTVADAYGKVSVGHAVEAWLRTEEGAAFLPPRPSEPGPYSQQIARLRETLH